MADKTSIFQPDALSASLELVRCRSSSVRVLHPPASFAVEMALGDLGFGGEAKQAMQQRAEFLAEQGLANGAGIG